MIHSHHGVDFEVAEAAPQVDHCRSLLDAVALADDAARILG